MNREFVNELREMIDYLVDMGFVCKFGRLQQVYERAERRGVVAITAADKRYIGAVRNLLERKEEIEKQLEDLLIISEDDDECDF